MKIHPSMIEATRLTRAGRLGEATALLRTMLGLGSGVETTGRSPREPTVLTPTSARLSGPAPSANPAGEGRPTRNGSLAAFVYADQHGRLGYKLYVPDGVKEGSPLLVMLHGCTQSSDDFALGTRMNRLADEHGFLVAYPEQSQSANASRCWNWFKSRDQRRDQGEPALIAGVTREIISQHRIDTRRVYVAGLSAGGAAAAIMGEVYPDLYAAVGVHSGLACGAAGNMAGALIAMRRGGGSRLAARPTSPSVPTIIFHGDHDTVVDKINGDELVARARAGSRKPLLLEKETGHSDGGRRYSRATLRDEEGRPCIEQWTVHGSGHAWSGGDPDGSYTDPIGPDASRIMVQFFLAQA